MKLKRYSKFLESKLDFSIYDWYEQIRNIRWSDNINESELQKNVEHFIGSGQWNLINGHFQKIFDVLDVVDVNYVNDRMLDIFDEYPYHDIKYVCKSVAYGDFERYYEPSDRRYNGLMSVTSTDTNRRLHVICHFLISLLDDVLWIRQWGEKYPTRDSKDELFVTSDEFSVKNFHKLNPQGVEFKNILAHRPATEFAIKKFVKFQSEFSVEKFLDLYRPSIFINLSADKPTKISHNKIRSEFEEILPSILDELDYEEVVWSWGSKTDQEDYDIYDYDVKILLKMQ